MKSIGVLFADGFEEIEAITIVDVLRRAALQVKMILELSPQPMKFATDSLASKITLSLLTQALPLPGAARSSVAAQTSLSITRSGLGQLVAALLR